MPVACKLLGENNSPRIPLLSGRKMLIQQRFLEYMQACSTMTCAMQKEEPTFQKN